MPATSTRLTATTAALVAAATLLLAALPPAGYYALGFMMERGMARSTASLTARLVEREITRNPDFWRFELHQLSAHLAPADAEVNADERAVLDTNGAALMRNDRDTPLSWPVVAERAALYDADRIVGYVSVARSVRALVWRTVALAGVCATLAGFLFVALCRRPLRTLRMAEQRLHELAHRDPLTGLPNRATFRHALAAAMTADVNSKRMVAVLFLDLDRFKRVNDTLGHHAGDALLKAVAERITESVRTDDLVARLSGDEFAVMIDTVAHADDAVAVADKVLAALAAPLVIEGLEIYVAPSIGIALGPLHARTPEALLKYADAAMYAAKRQGGGRYRIYERSMASATADTLDTDRRLRDALRKNEFRLMFQPVVLPATGRIIGAEALLRWHSPERGVVSPADFVPLLEETGLIVSVGEWVLREACRRAVPWLGVRGADFQLSVNVSPRQFKDGDIVKVVADALAHTGFPATQLQLEVTEGLLMDGSTYSLQAIERLAQMGVRVAVDDFGTGYSSLAYLKKFRLHSVKIDRTFVRDMQEKADDQTIVRAVTALAHNLGLSVTAEGVETEDQRALIHGIGCDYAQGYLFAQPLEPAAIDALLAGEAPPIAEMRAA